MFPDSHSSNRNRGMAPLFGLLFGKSDYISSYKRRVAEFDERIRLRRLREDAALTLESSEEDVIKWAHAWGLEMYLDEFRGCNGRDLLLMSPAREDEWLERLSGDRKIRIFIAIRKDRYSAGIRSKSP
jgi:hypothetical protein